MRPTPVAAPRRVFVSLSEFAAHLGTSHQVLLQGRYLDPAGDAGYALRPLDEAAYARWHRTVWASAQREKEAA